MTVKKVEDVLKNQTQGMRTSGVGSRVWRCRAAVRQTSPPPLLIALVSLHNLTSFHPAETEALNREANERFAAGYIQCMHEVHMFVSSCPGIDATVAAELLNHLLECMPLNEDHLQDTLMDLITDTSGSDGSTWHGGGESLCVTLESPRGRSGLSSVLSPAPSMTSSEDLCSDLDETDSEHNQSSTEGLEHREGLMTSPRSMWRPW